MAKMFYTLEEVCQKLAKSEDDVKEMARTGQIQEFRDRDKLMFKVDQIDLLAGTDEDTGEVHLELEDTSGGLSGFDLQESSGSALGLEESKLGLEESRLGLEESRLGLEESRMGLEESRVGLEESRLGLEESHDATGISVFDTEHGAEETGDQTHSGQELEEIEDDDELSLESVGSGSGLLDLTRESDDTSLGAELLEEVYSGDENIEIPGSASGLFEAATVEPGADVGPVEIAAAMPIVAEAYDGSGSGLGVGMMIGAMVALILSGIIVVVGIFGATPQLATQIGSSSSSLMIWGGGLIGGTILLGLVGLIIGKATG